MEQEKKNKVKKEKKEEPKKSLKREIFEWIMVFVVAAAMCAWMARPCSTRSPTASS